MPAPTAIKQGSGPDLGVKSEADNLVEARITALHVKLTITPAQERLWSHVSQVIKSYAEIAEVHAAGLQKFVPVFEALYASMSVVQKKNADTLFGSHNPVAKKSTKSKKQ